MSFICPNCAQPLQADQQSKSLRCENNHSFDCAKQGYYNLLLANQKASKEPGDSAEMLLARRLFLESGGYDFLVEEIAHLVQEHIERKKANCPEAFQLFDCGCGEGYYARKLQHLYPTPALPGRVFGLDIAKAGVRMAASAAKVQARMLESSGSHWGASRFAVASSAHLPIEASSMDIFLSVFAPFSAEEVVRVLQGDGVFIRVSPGPNHLQELKKQIYTTAKKHVAPEVPEEFKLLSEVCVGRDIDISSDDHFKNLLAMTPFAHKGMKEAKQTLMLPSNGKVRAEFFVQVLVP